MKKKIPIREKYDGKHGRWIKQTMDGEYPQESYFMYAGIFLHYWGLFEWCAANVIFEKKRILLDSRKSRDTKKVKQSNQPKTPLDKLKNCSSVEDAFRIDARARRSLLTSINKTVVSNIKSAEKLRNTIAHNNIFFTVNAGPFQFDSGWIKPDLDQKASQEHKALFINAKKNNPSITDDEVNLKIHATYTKNDIGKEIEKLIRAIKDLGYDISSEHTYQLLTKRGVLKTVV